MLMTPTSTPHGNIMKSFIKRNTPLRVDPKVRSCQGLGQGRLWPSPPVRGQLEPLWPWAASTLGTVPSPWALPGRLMAWLAPGGLPGAGSWARKLQN